MFFTFHFCILVQSRMGSANHYCVGRKKSTKQMKRMAMIFQFKISYLYLQAVTCLEFM